MEAADALTCVPTTPTVTEGPYWVDEKLFRSDIRTDPTTGVARAGIPLTLTINVQNVGSSTCGALTGAYVDIWHCDAKGIYSDESSYNPGGGTGTVVTTGQKFLRGYQITDDNGQVQFTTIYPGWYSGRTIHIHVRVRTYSGTTILSNFVTQIFFDEAVNNLVLSQSAYSRTGNRDTLNATDMVYNVANAARMLATVTGGVSAGYAATITLGAAFQTPAATAPSISAGGVGNAVGGTAGVTPGAWISIYGTSLATTTRLLTGSDLVDNFIPPSLGGVSVQIDGKAAFVQYISTTLINVLSPSDANRGTVAVTVTNAAGTASTTTTMLPVLPGLSVLSNYVRAVRPNGVIINGTGNAEPGYSSAAAIGQGEVLALYGTGFGPTSSSPADGLVFSGAYETTNRVTVTIGDLPAAVSWAGLVGPGLYQINVTIPEGLADGDHPVVATVLGSSSQSGALVKVAVSAKLTARNAMRRKSNDNAAASWARDKASIEHVTWLAGLVSPEQRIGANVRTEEREGCLVKIG